MGLEPPSDASCAGGVVTSRGIVCVGECRSCLNCKVNEFMSVVSFIKAF